jgi:hypothetical protein
VSEPMPTRGSRSSAADSEGQYARAKIRRACARDHLVWLGPPWPGHCSPPAACRSCATRPGPRLRPLPGQHHRCRGRHRPAASMSCRGRSARDPSARAASASSPSASCRRHPTLWSRSGRRSPPSWSSADPQASRLPGTGPAAPAGSRRPGTAGRAGRLPRRLPIGRQAHPGGHAAGRLDPAARLDQRGRLCPPVRRRGGRP